MSGLTFIVNNYDQNDIKYSHYIYHLKKRPRSPGLRRWTPCGEAFHASCALSRLQQIVPSKESYLAHKLPKVPKAEWADIGNCLGGWWREGRQPREGERGTQQGKRSGSCVVVFELPVALCDLLLSGVICKKKINKKQLKQINPLINTESCRKELLFHYHDSEERLEFSVCMLEFWIKTVGLTARVLKKLICETHLGSKAIWIHFKLSSGRAQSFCSKLC